MSLTSRETEVSRRRFLQTTAVGALALSSGGLLAACGKDEENTGSGGGAAVTWGFSHPFQEVPIVQTVDKLVTDFAEENGWKVLLDDTTEGNIQRQLQTLDTWITQKVTVITVDPLEPSAFEATAKRAVDAGIIWTTYAIPMETSAGGALIPSKASGEVTGKATIDWINKNNPTAEVIILESPAPGEVRARTDVPRKMLAQTNAKIVSVQAASDQSKGFQVTESILEGNPNATVVVGFNDDAGLGAAEAFRKQGKHDPSNVWIVGQDGSEEALTALKDPESFFRASAALDIRKLCEETVAVAKRALDRNWQLGDEQDNVVIEPTLITNGQTELVDEFLSVLR